MIPAVGHGSGLRSSLAAGPSRRYPKFTPKDREDLSVRNKYAFPREELDEYVPFTHPALKTAHQDLLGKLGREPPE